MKKSLHFSLLVLPIFLLLPNLKAQTDRVQFIKTEPSPIVAKTEINIFSPSPEKRIEKSLHPSSQERDSLLAKNITEKLVKNTTTITEATEKKEPGAPRKVKIIRTEEDNESNTDINAPLHPDFNVTAVKEEIYDNNTVSKETVSTQLVKLERVPADDLQAANSYVAGQSSKVTISPQKRKYLEGILLDLEKDIATGKNTLVETRAKKKELEDLKKMLNQ